MKTTLILILLLAGCSSAHPMTDAGMLPPDGSAGVDAGTDASLDVCALPGESDDLTAACSAWDNAALRARIIGCVEQPPCPWDETFIPTVETRIACAEMFDTIATCEDATAIAERCACL